MIAGMHLEGITMSWYQVFAMGKTKLLWPDFCTYFLARFGACENELLYDKFKNLKQEASVESYCNQFALAMGQLRIKKLTEEHFIEYFISGLQEEVK